MTFARVGMGRRVAALSIDWLMSYAVAYLLTRHSQVSERSFVILSIFFFEILILTTLQGASAGQKLLRIKVVRFADGGQVAPLQVLIRTILLVIVITAITYDEDGRGIHERVSGSVLTALEP